MSGPLDSDDTEKHFYFVHDYVRGQSATSLLTITLQPNRQYETHIALDSNGTLRDWNPADLAIPWQGGNY